MVYDFIQHKFLFCSFDFCPNAHEKEDEFSSNIKKLLIYTEKIVFASILHFIEIAYQIITFHFLELYNKVRTLQPSIRKPITAICRT